MNPWELDIWEMLLRLSLAVVLGGAIGIERERRNRAAGFRTNILVCVGSALIMLISIYGFTQFADEENVRLDPARLAAQVISGIGFLGAGVILFNGLSITGLTTAATLWVVAAIGLAVGAGFYYAAGITTVFVLFSLLALNKFEKRWLQTSKSIDLNVTTKPTDEVVGQVMKTIGKLQLETKQFSVNRELDERNSEQIVINMTITVSHSDKVQQLTEALLTIHDVKQMSIK